MYRLVVHECAAAMASSSLVGRVVFIDPCQVPGLRCVHVSDYRSELEVTGLPYSDFATPCLGPSQKYSIGDDSGGRL